MGNKKRLKKLEYVRYIDFDGTYWKWSVNLFWNTPLKDRPYGQLSCAEVKNEAKYGERIDAENECNKIVKALGIKKTK